MDDKTKELANAVKDWWEQHKYDVTGEHGDWNVFDEEPEFVTKAKEMLWDWEKLPATPNAQVHGRGSVPCNGGLEQNNRK